MLCVQNNNEFIGAPTYIGTSVLHGVFIADISIIRILLIGAPLIYTSDNNIHTVTATLVNSAQHAHSTTTFIHSDNYTQQQKLLHTSNSDIDTQQRKHLLVLGGMEFFIPVFGIMEIPRYTGISRY